MPEGLPEREPSAGVLARDAVYRRLLILSDVLAGCIATFGAVVIAGGAARLSLLVIAPLVVLIAKVLGLYERDELLLRKTTLDEASCLFQVATVGTLATWIGHDALASETFSTVEGALLWPLLFVLLIAGRWGARRLARALTPPERCVVVGNALAAESLKRNFDRSHAVNAVVVGRVPVQYGNRHGEDPWDATVPGSVPVIGHMKQLHDVTVIQEVDRVLVALPPGATDQFLDMIRAVKALGVKVSVVPRLFEVVGSSAAIDDVEGTTLLGIRRYGLGRSSRLMKRAMDVSVATVALCLLSPVALVVAIAVRLDSPGPVLFRQRRIGQGGREFEMVKFRTMVQDADDLKRELESLNEADGLFKIEDDPRITRVGKFLRKTCLDELPQLINVVRGDMSLVGPRPLVHDDDERVQGWHRRRLHVPPGMTGHWQILGSSRVPLGEMVKIDYLYGANWSLWGDLKILLRTVPYVLARRGQ